MTIENAVVTGLKWCTERGLSHTIYLDFGGSQQGFGGYLLVNNNSAAKWIIRLMEVFEIDDLSDKSVIGKVVRAKSEKGLIVSIGHPIKDIWLDAKTVFNMKINDFHTGLEEQHLSKKTGLNFGFNPRFICNNNGVIMQNKNYIY